MKNFRFITLALTAVMIVCILTGCGGAYVIRSGDSASSYPDAGRYSAGDRTFTSPVECIDIDWASGSVRVAAHDEKTVVITETSGDLADNLKVHSWLEGTTLHIRFCAAGSPGTFFSNLSGKKNLTVMIPENTVLSSFLLSSASATVDLSGFSADTVDVSSASGDVSACIGSAEALTFDSASGAVDLQVQTAGTVNIDTSSGDISLSVGQASSVRLDTASGEAVLRTEAMPGKCTVGTASGNVCLFLPEDASFTADIDTASGDLDFSLPLKYHNGVYTAGSGDASLSIDTASGDIRIFASD